VVDAVAPPAAPTLLKDEFVDNQAERERRLVERKNRLKDLARDRLLNPPNPHQQLSGLDGHQAKKQQ